MTEDESGKNLSQGEDDLAQSKRDPMKILPGPLAESLIVVGRWMGYLAQILVLLHWIVWLFRTDAYYSAYLFLMVLGMVAASDNLNAALTCPRAAPKRDMRTTCVCAIGALLAGLAVTVAEHAIEKMWLDFLILFSGAAIVGWNVLTVLMRRLRGGWELRVSPCCPHPLVVFGAAFLVLVASHLYLLFTAFYPGSLSPDSMDQIGQALGSCRWNNHQPFAHSMIIKGFLAVGRSLFGNINAAVATYIVFHVLYIAFGSSYFLATLARMRVSPFVILLILAWFLFMPFHITYALVMWKDPVFGVTMLILVTSVYRAYALGKPRWPLAVSIAASALGVCLFRSNGWPSVLSLAVVAFLLRKGRCRRPVGWTLSIVLVVFFLIKGVLYPALGVIPPGTAETYGLLLNQTGSVVVGGGNVTPEEKDFLGKLYKTEKLRKTYDPCWTWPTKQAMDHSFFVQNKGRFLWTWLSVGLRNPGKYVKAWAELTKGYWNAGYKGKWGPPLTVWPPNNPFGIVRETKDMDLWKALANYDYAFVKTPFLNLFASVGLHVWGIVAVFLACLVFRRWQAVLALPLIMVLLTLMAASPLRMEFRLAYSIVCCAPLMLTLPFVRTDEADLDNDKGVVKA